MYAIRSYYEGVHEAQTYGEAVNLLVDNGKKRLPQIERVLKKSKINYRSIRIAPRITSYNVCYTKLLRADFQSSGSHVAAMPRGTGKIVRYP